MIFLGATTSVKADPFSLIFNIFGGQRNTPVYYDNQYQCQESRAQYQQRNTLHQKVTYITRDGEMYQGAPPPQAYRYVTYPGPAPKCLYKDKSIQVQSHGDSHTIVYRKPGW
jgi:hypothetical protein